MCEYYSIIWLWTKFEWSMRANQVGYLIGNLVMVQRWFYLCVCVILKLTLQFLEKIKIKVDWFFIEHFRYMFRDGVFSWQILNCQLFINPLNFNISSRKTRKSLRNDSSVQHDVVSRFKALTTYLGVTRSERDMCTSAVHLFMNMIIVCNRLRVFSICEKTLIGY